MSCKTSDGIVGRPFSPKKDRGFWSNPHDFAWACLNNGFRIDNIYGITIVPLIVSNGWFAGLIWLVGALLFAVPLFFVQSFLGQFSSSGFISAFRISPLFKGLGYIALLMNIISLAFHGTVIAVPLLFLIHSLQPTLPWSCDANRPWSKEIELTSNKSREDWDVYRSHCNINHSEITDDDWIQLLVPSVEFFWHKVSAFNFEIFACVLIVWTLVTFTVSNSSEKVGIFFRYCTIIVVTLLGIVFIRMLFLPDIWQNLGISKSYYSGKSDLLWIIMPAFTAFTIFTPEWGSVLSLASYNKFKTNIVKYSWVIPICQLVMLTLLGLLSDFAEVHMTKDHRNVIPPFSGMQWISLMTIPSTLATMGAPHLWTWMFLLMVVLGCFNLAVIQMFSIKTALFDEFEKLRRHKKTLTFGSAALLALASAFICTLDGLKLIEKVINMHILSQSILNLILILVLLWAYGQERLRRDVEFMTAQVVSNWKWHYIRYVTPVLFGLLFFVVLFFGERYHHGYLLLCLLVAFLPWIALPTYGIYVLSKVTGSLKKKFSRCIQPTEWYPVDSEDKLRYQESFGNQDSVQPLTTISP